MLNYSLFYRRTGIRRVEQLSNPILTPMATMKLPDMSFFHYVGGESEVGPSPDYFLLNDVKRDSWLDHTYRLLTQEGKPRPHKINYEGEIRNYHRRFVKIKWLKRSPASVTDPRLVVGRAYSGLFRLYRYVQNPYRQYYEWKNVWNTIWHDVETIANTTQRNQFIVFDLPQFIPPMSKFLAVESNLTPQTLRYFKDMDALNLMDMWFWLGDKRKESLLSAVSTKNLNKVNLIFLQGGKFTVLNLGLLNSWRTTPEQEVQEDADSAMKGIDPQLLRKRFLHFLLKLSDVKIEEAVSKELEDEENADEADGVIPLEQPDTKDLSKAFKLEDDEEDIDNEADDLKEVEEDAFSDIDIDEELNAHDELAIEFVEKDAAKSDEVATQDDYSTLFAISEPFRFPSEALDARAMEKAKVLVDQGVMTLPELKRHQALVEKYKTLKSPFSDKTLAEEIDIKPEDLILPVQSIPDSPTIVDKSMLKSSLSEFDSAYVKNIIHRDILSAILNFQKTGVAVADISVTETMNALNHFNTYSIKLVPPAGKQTTISIKIPVVNEDGTILSGGVKYYLKKQRSDIPIRKIGPSRVALTSYYGKLFIDRSENATVNYGRWLTNNIRAIGLDNENVTVTSMKMANAYDKTLLAPRVYSAIAMSFKSFVVKPVNGGVTDRYHFFFDHKKLSTFINEDTIAKHEKNGNLVVGKDQIGAPIVIDGNGVLAVMPVSGKVNVIGTFEDILGLDTSKMPNEVATVNVFGKAIPLVTVLGYHMGFSKLLNLLNVTPRVVERGKMVKLQRNEFAVKFKDVVLVFERNQRTSSIILAGLKVHHRAIDNIPVKDMDNKDTYANLLDSMNLGVRYVRELDSILDLYVDPITRDLLKEMGEPIDMIGLYLRSAELLTTDQHPDEIDGALTRYKGYERFSGTVYAELVKAFRIKSARPISARVGVELNPEHIWQQILQDSAMEVTNDINPIQNLKQKEVVTFGGTGGRSADTMVKRTRIYPESDVGIISGATVDSGAVGVISYFSANPNIVDLRGRVRKFDEKKDGTSSLLDTSALTAPAVDMDDAKRANFVQIQQSHGIAAKGYTVSPLRTGYEQILAHRCDDLFAYTAKGKGKIIFKDQKVVTVEYEDGSTKSIEIGRRFGKSAGSVIPHQLECELEVGDAVELGDVVVYNSEYFAKDWINPKQVSWKAGVMTNVLIMDTADTYEDSSVISDKIAGLMESSTSHIRQIVLDFDQAPHNLVEVGGRVDFESILCTIEDPVTVGANLFDAETLETLKLLSNAAPKAKYTGVVEHIEVYYHGEVDDMSEALQSLVMSSDRAMGRLYKNLGKPKITGKVDGTYRVDGNPLLKNQAVINIYITSNVSMGVGDKLVFANQMKSTVGRVMTGVNRIKDGEDIGAIFAYESISNRIVLSPEAIGTTNTTLDVIGKRFVEIYKGGNK